MIVALAILLVQGSVGGGEGAGVPGLRGSGEPGSELTVTLLTYETGGAVWERFGHNALWIHDAATGSEHHYDYGRFDFKAPNFFLHFAQGKMAYSMGDTGDVAGMIAFYTGQGRKVWAQELDLSPAQRVALRDFLAWNIRPENAGYAYDYYLDNCSTRIRDALDRVLGGAIQRYADAPSGFTWREETRRLNQNNPALYVGLMTWLGQPVDRMMTRWQQMFLPIRLREHLDSVRISGPEGVERPLVRQARVLAPGGKFPVPAVPENWTWRFLGIGAVLGGLLAWLGRRRSRGFAPLATVWSALAGVLGLVLTWLWVFSSHVAAYRNENVFLFNVLVLLLAIAIPFGGKLARRLSAMVTGIAALGLALKLLAAFDQQNLELIALALPLHAGVLLGLRAREPS